MTGNKNKTKLVYFDLGGVFFNWKIGLKKIADITSSPIDKVNDIFKTYDPLVISGEEPPDFLYSKYREILECDDFANGKFVDYWTSLFIPFPDVIEFASQLSLKIDLGIISNIYDTTFDYFNKRKLIPQIRWKYKIMSYQLKMTKPDIDIYKYAQKLTGIPNENILFIDDTKENLINPVKLGWKTVWFDAENIKESIINIEKQLDY